MLYIDASFNSEFGVPTSSGTDLDIEVPVVVAASVAEIVDTFYSAGGLEFKGEDISSYFSAAPYLLLRPYWTLYFFTILARLRYKITLIT